MIANSRKEEQILNYSFKEGLLLEIEVVDLLGLYQVHAHQLTLVHRTSFYHIIWFQKSTIHLVDFTPVKIEAGSLLFVNKDTVQQFSNTENEGKVLLFTDQFFGRTEPDLKFLKSTVLFNDLLEVAQIRMDTRGQNIEAALAAIEVELQNAPDNFQSPLLHNHLYNLLLLSERAYRHQGFREIVKSPDLDYTLLFKEILESNYKAERYVSFFAAQMNITEKRLNIATSKVLGKTPKEIIHERVLLECKRLLAHTSVSVKEIGYELGFDEPTNFIKYFKKHSSQTPIAFRSQFSI